MQLLVDANRYLSAYNRKIMGDLEQNIARVTDLYCLDLEGYDVSDALKDCYDERNNIYDDIVQLEQGRCNVDSIEKMHYFDLYDE